MSGVRLMESGDPPSDAHNKANPFQQSNNNNNNSHLNNGDVNQNGSGSGGSNGAVIASIGDSSMESASTSSVMVVAIPAPKVTPKETPLPTKRVLVYHSSIHPFAISNGHHSLPMS
jgi:hypothetical protein